jgi:HD-GYP domain-containing protein (c-di-GMP phosphodiesterase class II)/ActR/RegA family two-component response regulator
MNQSDTEEFHILAVDDEQSILSLYQQILCGRQGIDHASSLISSFNVTLCDHGDQAVEALREGLQEHRSFPVAFLDVHMSSGPDGVQTAERIRDLDPDLAIVFVTGDSGTNPLEIARRVPPPDKLFYLLKPFHPQEILQFASAMCERRLTEIHLKALQSGLEGLVDKRTAALEETNTRLKCEMGKRNEAEKASRASEENFRNIITSNSDGILVLDHNGIVRFMNPAAEILFQRKAENLLGKLYAYPVSADESVEIDIIRKDGNHAVAEMHVVTTQWQGGKAYLASLRNITEKKQSQEDLKRTLQNLRKAMGGTIEAMALTVETRDPYTAGHQRRVADLACAMATEMGLAKEQIEGTRMAGVIHDLGKIAVPAEILSKPTRLSEIEFAFIKIHPQVGYDILKRIEFPWPIAQVVMQHHERMDGSGYPQGLSSDEILMEARIIAVADVVEAMASHRPYRAALGIDKALAEISQNKGVTYDPQAVEGCLKLFSEKGFTFK